MFNQETYNIISSNTFNAWSTPHLFSGTLNLQKTTDKIFKTLSQNPIDYHMDANLVLIFLANVIFRVDQETNYFVEKEKINENLQLSARKPIHTSIEFIETLLNTDFGHKYFKKHSNLKHAPICQFVYALESIDRLDILKRYKMNFNSTEYLKLKMKTLFDCTIELSFQEPAIYARTHSEFFLKNTSHDLFQIKNFKFNMKDTINYCKKTYNFSNELFSTKLNNLIIFDIAVDNKYQPSINELKSIFIQNLKLFTNNNNPEPLVSFITTLYKTNVFKHSIEPTNNISKSIIKFFSQELKQENILKEYFSRCLENPVILYLNLQNKLNKNKDENSKNLLVTNIPIATVKKLKI